MDKTRRKEVTAAGKVPCTSNPSDAVALVESDPTCGGRFQERIPPPGTRRATQWVPGAVHLVFKWGFRPELFTEAFSLTGKDVASDEKVADFRGLLERHNILSYEPTFAFIPPGEALEVTPPPGRNRYYTLHFSDGVDTARVAEALNSSPLVEYAAPVPRIIPPTSPAQEPLALAGQNCVMQQWYLRRCRVEGAWDPPPPAKGVSGEGVIVADIDWGFRTSHQELRDRIKLTYNAIDGTTHVDQGCRDMHGTAVLGILGAGATGVGMVGFAHKARLWAIQAANDNVDDPKFWAAAIDYVRTAPGEGRRKVICLEGMSSGDLNIEVAVPVNKAIRDAIASGVVVCVAAGNGNWDVGLDANGNPFPETGSILVGATVFDPDETVNRRAEFSNWGERVVVSAPGDMANDVSCSSGADNGYLNNFGGTSGATPKVAGTVALMLEANPKLSHCEVRDILRATGTSITDAASKPAGTFLNAEAAVREARKRAG